ncbi:MAG: PepSY domain-containing protein [Defluviitaleaceae bacterium]|nr:PepSY domain-containing protein [Defluviitaleaceae bacterium]
MISVFGLASFFVFVLCCTGLVLHYHIMKKRARLDNALHEMETAEEPVTDEFEAALADYNACVSRFPFNAVAKVLNLPHEQNE